MAAAGKKYYVVKGDRILGYADGWMWIPRTQAQVHRMATQFISSAAVGGKQFGEELKTFLTANLGEIPPEELAKLEVFPFQEWWEKEEEKLTSPWALAEGMIRAKAKRILLYGPPGVGKSFTPWKVAEGLGAGFFSITLTDMTPMAELRGHFVVRGSDTVWHDGVLSRAWRESHSRRTFMVLNEIDHAGADAESFLHNFLDDPEMARIYLPTGECLTPGDIQVVATMNGEPGDLADALRDRFTVRVEIPTPHPEAIASLPLELREFAERMITNPPRGQERMSLRAFKDFVQLVDGAEKGSGGVLQAARAIFGALGDDVVQALKIANA